ncbi:hypothetical protein BOTBODRAFT_27273 [Botryobasidium botryosum FD-172 SS1]|uniref:Copper acquisition factor BIM1-like domain-containing protein n=1 Tax=Botryobasidium botryosum (strain FD-172 SS1) TaxID=930990 RepID=A0A067MW93_BOTB1|nr:hypothetical protein BOTBODRAFT_27273 [Botryobasidium botryosum FD-172 SS1]
MFARAILTITALASIANAHFQLTFPQSRGFTEDIEPNFCGGYPNPEARVPFPLGQAFFTINSEHPKANLIALISLNQDPTSLAQFNTTPSGQTIPPLAPFTAVGQGSFCIPVNVGALNLAGVQSGTNATIQIQYDGGDGNLYQCADVTLSSTYTIPSNVSCTNSTSTSSGSSGNSASSGPGLSAGLWLAALGAVLGLTM